MEEEKVVKIMIWRRLKKPLFICVGIIVLIWLACYLLLNTSWAQRERAIKEIQRAFQIDIKDIDFYYENNLKVLGIGKNGTLMVKFTVDSKVAEEMIPNYSNRWEPEDKRIYWMNMKRRW